MENFKTELINIDSIIKTKNPKLAKYLPFFVKNYIKKVIHQDELNKLISDHNQFFGLDFIKSGLPYFETKTTIFGSENIPKTGKYIFAANHPIGSLDGVIFMHEMGKYYGETKSIVNDLLLNVNNFKPLFVGVNKHGSTSRENVEMLDEIFNSDLQILLFPSGFASRRIKGKIVDFEWKKTVISRAIKHKRDIVPVYIKGQLSNFFYNLYSFRKFLGIKTNLEMFYLVDEMFRQKGKQIDFYFGKSIPYTYFDKTLSHQQWAENLKNHVYKLENDINSVFI